MFKASPLMRTACCLAAAVLALAVAPAARSQTIDVSLNVFYDNPSDVNSGGFWEVVAKTTPGLSSGIAGVNVHLTNVHSAAQFFQVLAPRGIVNGTDDAGFTVDLFNGSGYRTLSAVQIALALEPGEEGAFYGVGTLANGDPGDIGPVYSTLTNVQGTPWGAGDLLGNAAWNTAVRLARGSFSDNLTPGFTLTPTGGVYTELGTATMVGDSMNVPVTTIVRTNFVPGAGTPGDYNDDGAVNAADYVVWRKGLLAADGSNNGTVGPEDYDIWFENFGEGSPGGGGSGGDYNDDGAVDAADYVVWRDGLLAADGSGNGTIGPEDYDIWLENFGEASPGTGGGGAVPEPATAVLALFCLGFTVFGRRRRA